MGKLYLGNGCSEKMLSMARSIKNVVFLIDGIEFNEYGFFNKVRKDKLTAEQVFSIENIEQRRIAYNLMDKTKMNNLKNLKVLHSIKNDGCGFPKKTIEINIDGYDEPFRYLNCFCASSGREYNLQTKEKNCWDAKAGSFGLKGVNGFKRGWWKEAYRHGDLALIPVKKLPSGCEISKSKTLMTGSNNNPHTFDNGTFYLKNEDMFVFGYFEAKDTTLFHKDHGVIASGKKLREAKIKNGIYQLRGQFEETHSGMVQVVD